MPRCAPACSRHIPSPSACAPGRSRGAAMQSTGLHMPADTCSHAGTCRAASHQEHSHTAAPAHPTPIRMLREPACVLVSGTSLLCGSCTTKQPARLLHTLKETPSHLPQSSSSKTCTKLSQQKASHSNDELLSTRVCWRCSGTLLLLSCCCVVQHSNPDRGPGLKPEAAAFTVFPGVTPPAAAAAAAVITGSSI